MKRLIAVMLGVLLVAAPASAAFWTAAWAGPGSITNVVGPGQWTQIAIGSESSAQLSPGVFCNSDNGCTVRIVDSGSGVYSLYYLVGRNDETVEASYEDSGQDISTDGQYIDLTRGWYAFYADTATGGSGIIEFSGN